MASFSFGFRGEDIEDHKEAGKNLQDPGFNRGSRGLPCTVIREPQLHTLEDLLNDLPARAAFEIIPETESLAGPTLVRRPLWDVRMQMMEEDDLRDGSLTTDESRAGLGADDVLQGVYEGGLKSWESSYDLVAVINERKSQLMDFEQIFELGAGTALPSITLFLHLLNPENSHLTDRATKRFRRFTICDFNYAVLRAVTFPNLILNWALAAGYMRFDDAVDPDSSPRHGDLEFSPTIVDTFCQDLSSLKLSLAFASGSWGPDLARIRHGTQVGRGEGFETEAYRTLVLTSETIYSPSSLPGLVQCLEELLDAPGSYGLLAAKQVYFGVGGGIEEFEMMVNQENSGEKKQKLLIKPIQHIRGPVGVARRVLGLDKEWSKT